MNRMTNFHPTFAPTVGEFTRLCRQVIIHEFENRTPEIADKSERTRARNAVNTQYAKRLTGMRFGESDYDGAFDVNGFVANQEVPPIRDISHCKTKQSAFSETLPDHSNSWAKVWKSFDEVFSST